LTLETERQFFRAAMSMLAAKLVQQGGTFIGLGRQTYCSTGWTIGELDYSVEMQMILEEEKNMRPNLLNAEDTMAFLNELCSHTHLANKKWWHDPQTGQPIQRNVGEMLMLCVSELAEAMEGHRKGLKDDKLPTRTMLEVELADCIIRIFDISAGLGLDLGGAYVEKMAYNSIRADHKPENRIKEGGKKY